MPSGLSMVRRTQPQGLPSFVTSTRRAGPPVAGTRMIPNPDRDTTTVCPDQVTPLPCSLAKPSGSATLVTAPPSIATRRTPSAGNWNTSSRPSGESAKYIASSVPATGCASRLPRSCTWMRRELPTRAMNAIRRPSAEIEVEYRRSAPRPSGGGLTTKRTGSAGEVAPRVACHATIAIAAASPSAYGIGLAYHARRRVAPPANDPCAPDTAKVALPSASPNALALSNRSAGSFSSALASAATTFGGTFRRKSLTGRASSVMIRMITCCAAPPTCGGWPASIS